MIWLGSSTLADQEHTDENSEFIALGKLRSYWNQQRKNGRLRKWRINAKVHKSESTMKVISWKFVWFLESIVWKAMLIFAVCIAASSRGNTRARPRAWRHASDEWTSPSTTPTLTPPTTPTPPGPWHVGQFYMSDERQLLRQNSC